MDLGVRQVGHVVGTAARLLVTEAPMLLTVALLGSAVRSASHWGAVVVSDHSGLLAQFALMGAPLGYLGAIIVMLHLLGRRLPNLTAVKTLSGPHSPTEHRERRLVDIFASVLVPFLAVYVSYGLWQSDRERFVNDAAFAEFNRFSLDEQLEYDYANRVGFFPLTTVVVIVVIAFVLRWGLGRLERTWHFIALAFVGALVEVYYTTQVGAQMNSLKVSSQQWVESRRAAAVLVEKYDAVVAQLGPLANPIDHVTSWLFGLIGAVDAVVIVPLAWLTVAAVVLGHKLTPPPTVSAEDSRILKVLPSRVRTMATELTQDIVARASAFWSGLRLIGARGLLPMLVFGLVFILALRLPLLVSLAWRQVAGPTATDTWLAFSQWEDGVGIAVQMIVTAVLLVAALEWLIAPSMQAEAEPAALPADAAQRGKDSVT